MTSPAPPGTRAGDTPPPRPAGAPAAARELARALRPRQWLKNVLVFAAPQFEDLELLYPKIRLEEEGAAVVVAGLLLSLLRRLRAAPRAALARAEPGSLLAAGIAFLAVEAFFQFPFGTACGCLFAAVLLGLALASLETPAPVSGAGAKSHRTRASWRIAGTVVTAVVLVLLGRTVASEWLFVNRNQDVGAQEAACRFNRRNLPACVTAAWLHARAGDRPEARALLVGVLRRSPYYYPAIRMLGEVAAADGDRRGACLYLWTYDELFRGLSPIHSRLHALCDKTPPAGVPTGVTMPYYGRMPLASSDAVVQ